MGSVEEKIEQYGAWMDEVHQAAIDRVERPRGDRRAVFEAAEKRSDGASETREPRKVAQKTRTTPGVFEVA